MNDLTLLIRRTIRARPERVFQAWTQPELFVQWWGPDEVQCPSAEIDLRVGGAYRVEHLLPDGRRLWLEGTFEVIDPPRTLVYTWSMGGGPIERVHVAFGEREGHTDVLIRHERIADRPTYEGHERGWSGCLDGLRDLVPAL